MTELTYQERAALLFHIIEGCDTQNILYRIARGEETYNSLTEASKKTSASKWWNSAKIIKAVEEMRLDLLRRRQKIEDEAKEQFRREETESESNANILSFAEEVNYLNRDEFLKALNKQANEIKDERLKNDTLKMLSDALRYKEADKAQNIDIHRFYTPLLCENCPLYQKESEIIKESKRK